MIPYNQVATCNPSVSSCPEPLEEKTQTKKKREPLRITVIFSIVSIKKLVDENGELDDPVTLYNRPHNVNVLAWEDENGAKITYKQDKVIPIECGDMKIDEDYYMPTDSLDDYSLSIEKVSNALFKIRDFCNSKKKPDKEFDIHLSLASFFPIEGILFAFANLFKKTYSNGACYDSIIKVIEMNPVLQLIVKEITGNGNKVTVDYACLYENYDLYIHRNYDIRSIFNVLNDNFQQEEFTVGNVTYTRDQLWTIIWDGVAELDQAEQIEFLDSLPPRLNGEIGIRGEIIGMNSGGKGAAMLAHLGLGVLSLIPVVGSVFSLLDAGIHLGEFIEDGDPTHWIDIGIDVVCCIPFVALAKTAKLGKEAKALKALGESGELTRATNEAVALENKAIRLTDELNDARKIATSGSKADKLKLYNYTETTTNGVVTINMTKKENIFTRVERLQTELAATTEQATKARVAATSAETAKATIEANMATLKTERAEALGVKYLNMKPLEAFRKYYGDYFRSIPKVVKTGTAAERIETGAKGVGMIWVFGGNWVENKIKGPDAPVVAKIQ